MRDVIDLADSSMWVPLRVGGQKIDNLLIVFDVKLFDPCFDVSLPSAIFVRLAVEMKVFVFAI